MSNVLSRAWRFIYTNLQADPELQALVSSRIHRGAVPQGGQFPAVIYALIAPGMTLTAIGGEQVWGRPVFKVVGAHETSDGLDLEPIADRIDAVLHNASGTTDAGGYVYSCQNLRPFELIETTGQSEFQQLGAEYGIEIKAS